jgi:hypothetical protein
MPETIVTEKNLAEAVTKLVDSLHHKYPGIGIRPISNYEDEDFTFEITIPKDLPIDQVEQTCHMECIKTEDEYDLF